VRSVRAVFAIGTDSTAIGAEELVAVAAGSGPLEAIAFMRVCLVRGGTDVDLITTGCGRVFLSFWHT